MDILRAGSSLLRSPSYPTSRRGGALLHKEAIFLAKLRVSEVLALCFINKCYELGCGRASRTMSGQHTSEKTQGLTV